MKKAQFYLFGSIILISYVFFVLANKSTISLNTMDDLRSFLGNYVFEANNIINNAVYNNYDVSESLSDYTKNFIEYAKLRNAELGIVYLYSYAHEIHIVNYLNQPVITDTGSLGPGEESAVEFQEQVGLTIDDSTYFYEFSDPDVIEFKALMVK